ncbi:response regulator [uncultured Pseudonocardia sp.]|uniref:response regulator n=1 Tax=uncultured Pseudonocardia sp. TaxID=211455 RepID=UPI002626ED3E|nr:response regulator transcription factor [uncultured Pseudonocardia sp.]
MRVALAEDSGIVRAGLTRLLDGAGIVRYAARNGDELLAFLTTEHLDAVLLDVRMPPDYSEEGLAAAEAIKRDYPHIGVLVLSTYGETGYAMRLMAIPEPGVGFLLKDRVDDVATLVASLQRVALGQSAVDPEIIAALLRRGTAQRALTGLAPREVDVLRLMAEGRSNAGVAEAMGINTRTVESYAARVFTKLDIPADSVDNRRVLAVLAWLRDGPTLKR